MAFRRSGRHRVVTVSRRLTQWVGSADNTAAAALGAGAAVLDQSLVLAGEPVTIVRTRGIITVGPDQTANNENIFGALGMCIVSDQAVAIGITAIPTPITDSSSDLFFLHQYFASGVRVADATGIANLTRTFHFDSKAMRKVSEDQTLVVTVENSSATTGLEYILQFRMLLKLA